MSNILITSAGRRVDLVDSFKIESRKLDRKLKVFCVDLNPELSPACQVADSYFLAPSVTSDEYISFLKQLCIENFITLIVPTIDTELLILSKHREEFLGHGINIVISDSIIIEECRDKNYTSNLLKTIDINTPIIYNAKKIKYPCFVKPYDGSSSLGAFALNDESMLTEDILKNPKNMFMELVPKSYDEYTVDVYFDKSGNLKSLVPRLRIETRAGEVSKGLTSKGSVYDYLKVRLSNLKGARGCITLQLFVNLKEWSFKAFDINPRFGGGYPLSYAAGANFPKMLIQEYILEEGLDFIDDWEDNLLMLRYDSKILIHDYKS
jgi:carbamoyl-phosphate synthase large subunit